MKKLINFLILLIFSSAMYGQDPQLLKKANAGDAKAQYDLAEFYLPKSESISEEGLKWLIKAAENGYALAQWNLSHGYKNGWHGLPENKDKYVFWLKKAADHLTRNCTKKEKERIAYAQYSLGNLYQLGVKGVEENMSEAIKWYKKSAYNGEWLSASSLARYYQYADDNKEAIYWFKKQMDIVWEERGEEDDEAFNALRKLGVTYHPGDHVSHSSGSSSSTVTNQNNSGSHNHQAQQVWKERWNPCISCDPDRKGRCKQCHGRGYYYIGNIHNICTSCSGTGACVWCGGRGEIKETYSVWE